MPQKFEVPKLRIFFIMILITGVFLVYLIYLASMQIVNFSEYQRRATEVASRGSGNSCPER